MLAKAVEEMIQDNTMSPGLCYTQHLFYGVPVFLYGTEKTSQSRHFRLRGAEPIGRGLTQDKEFVMLKSQYNSPVVVHRPHAPTAHRVSGEIYILPVDTLFDLDSDYENTLAFDRQRRTIEFTYEGDKDKNPTWFTASCFMYHGCWDLWKSKIEKGQAEKLNPYVESVSKHTAYIWMYADDKPNRDRLEQFKAASAKLKNGG